MMRASVVTWEADSHGGDNNDWDIIGLSGDGEDADHATAAAAAAGDGDEDNGGSKLAPSLAGLPYPPPLPCFHPLVLLSVLVLIALALPPLVTIVVATSTAVFLIYTDVIALASAPAIIATPPCRDQR